MSLLREWIRGSRFAIGAVTTGVTLLLWGMALRPWMWNWDTQPGPRDPGAVADVTDGSITLGDALGLGIEPDLAAIEQYRTA